MQKRMRLLLLAALLAIIAVAIAFAVPRDTPTGGSVGTIVLGGGGDALSGASLPVLGDNGGMITPGCTKDSECNDHVKCTDDRCDTSGMVGVCAYPPKDCNDDDACTEDSCDEQTGQCTHSTKTCSDNNPCTTDTCSAISGCVFTNNQLPCDDKNGCTANDVCNGGFCTGGNNICGCPNGCDDGNLCTDDRCDISKQIGVCAYTNVDCNDNDACNGVETCSPSTGCVSGAQMNCDDGVACTIDSCSAGACQHDDSGCACTSNSDCGDNNPCTTDTCSASSGCVFTNNQLPCDDKNGCTANDVCNGGVCTGGKNICGCAGGCDDGNLCTTDTCSASSVCVFTNNQLPCDDGNGCTANDVCNGGVCTGGKNICECRASGDCTARACKTVSCISGMCDYSSAPEGTSCDDRDSCTAGDRCVSGVCKGNNVCECERDSDCDDGDPATNDSCAGKVCKHVRTGAVAALATPAEAYVEENITLTIDTYPRIEQYAPGSELSKIIVAIRNQSGPVEGASVLVTINGTAPQSHLLGNVGAGNYEAYVNYTIPTKRLLPITAFATVNGQEANKTKYLFVGTGDPFYLLVNKPLNNEKVAPGQDVLFETEVEGMNPLDQLSDVSVSLIDERSDEAFGMQKSGDAYSKSVEIPKNVYETAYFLLLAKAKVNGIEQENAERIVLTRLPELHLDFDRSRQDVKSGLFALTIRYIDKNGDIIKDQIIRGRIIGYPSRSAQEVMLVRDGDVFASIYRKAKGDNSAEVQVWDAYNNSGKADVPPEFFAEREELKIPWDLITIVAIGWTVIAAGFFAFRHMMENKVYKSAQKKMLAAQKKQLEDLISKTKLQFYKRQISSEVANRRISEYEERLKRLEQ